MTFNKKINQLRRAVLKSLTKGIGQSVSELNLTIKNPSEIKKILVIRPNHRLGNLLLITPIIQEITNHFPDAKIDLFVKGGLAPLVFKNYHQFDKFIELPKKPLNELGKYLKGWLKIKTNRYDMVINTIEGSSSGRISTQLAKAKFKFFGDSDSEFVMQFPDHGHISKFPVYNFRGFLQKSGFKIFDSPVPDLDIKLSNTELALGNQLLKELVKNEQKTICLFTNATGDKIYDSIWWEDLYKRLLIEFPNFNIIELLPVEKTSQLDFKLPTYFNSDVRISGSLIANTAIFIAADSGMMHLSSAVNAPTVGFFKVTDTVLYAPYNGKSMAFDTNNSNIEDWIASIKDILLG